MWGRSDTKWVAEALFASGVLTTAHRAGFARHYDLTEECCLPRCWHAKSMTQTLSVNSPCVRRRHWGRHRGRHPRLFPAAGRSGEARPRVAVEGGRAGARRGFRLVRASLSARWPGDPRTDRGRRCCVPSTRWSSFPRVERLFGSSTGSRSTPRSQTSVRVLRLAVPLGRKAGGPGRPQG